MNKKLIATIVTVASLFLAFSITYFYPTQKLLGLVPLNLSHWSLLILPPITLILVIEIIKAFFKPKKVSQKYGN